MFLLLTHLLLPPAPSSFLIRICTGSILRQNKATVKCVRPAESPGRRPLLLSKAITVYAVGQVCPVPLGRHDLPADARHEQPVPRIPGPGAPDDGLFAC